MLLFFNDPPEVSSSSSDYTAGKDIIKQATDITDSIKKFVAGDFKSVFQNLSKEIISIENTSKTLQKSMGGVAFNTQNLTQQLYRAYKVNMEIGATFKDSADVLQGMASEMGRMVGTSDDNLANMVLFSKLTGISSESVGKMVAEMMRYGGSQEDAFEKMNAMRKEAIVLGLNANKFVTDVNSNLKKLSGFGFKDGVKGLSNMVKQAQLLRTNIESIGAAALQSKVLDPEGAMEAAASFQMLGGAVGKLGDPFQLLRMAQSDMEGLQKELVNSTKSAFKFNKETGEFKAPAEDLYRLREQAKIVGGDFEKMAEAGREAAKLEFIENAIDLSNVSEESKGLLASLSSINKDGKVTIDVPGFDSQSKTLDEILNNAGKKAELDQALAEYEQKMGMSDKQLAVDQLSISQQQLITEREIKEAIMKEFTSEERKAIENQVKTASDQLGEVSKELTTKGVGAGKTASQDLLNYYGDKSNFVKTETAGEKRIREEQEAENMEQSKTTITKQGSDMLFKPGSAPQLLTEGTLYKGIVGDEVAIGTKLTDALNKGGGSIGGKIDININLNGSITGDPGQLNKMFNSPEVQKQIMDTVLYKLNDYKRQQGVIS
jgi:hypothetical protein